MTSLYETRDESGQGIVEYIAESGEMRVDIEKLKFHNVDVTTIEHC